MRIGLKYLGLIFCFWAFQHSITAQILVQPGISAAEMGSSLTGNGVTVVGTPTLNCAGSAYGSFNNPNNPGLGISNGVLLTTGSAAGAAGPNNNDGISIQHNTLLNDANLLSLQSTAFNDVCRLELDVIPQCDSLTIRFIFGSEEYPDFVNSNFNDAFGFFVSGPNPNGGNYNAQNIAVLPNNNVVSINTVNAGTGSQFFVNNVNGSALQYNGYTVVLSPRIKVVPCQTYHFKLIIGDAGDDSFDSGVLIDFISCTTAIEGTVNTTTSGCQLDNGTATVAIDGGIGPFEFNWSHDANLNGPSASNLAPGDYQVEVTDMGIPCAQPFLLNYTITEFGPLPILFLSTDDTTPCIGDTIVVNGASNSTFAWTNPVPFQTSGNSAEFIVTPNFTGVQAIATNLCGPTTTNLSISPVSSPEISILTNPVICQNSPFILDASLAGNGLLTWTTPNGSVLNGTTANLGPAQLSQAGWYYATSTFSGCEPVLDSIEITVDELPIVNIASASICVGENVDITILPIENYTWPLLPGISQSNGGANATLSPTISTNYVVQNIHQCAVNINITVLPLPEPLISLSTLQGCSPLGVQFTDNTVEPLSFSWDFGDGQTSINESPFHVFTGTNTDTTYTVQLSITDNNGCVNQNNFFIQTMVPVDAQFTANPISQIYPDAVVDFTNVSTGSGTLSAVWLYENETSTNFNSASHTFSTWGNFTVSLIVENEWCNDTAEQEIVILPPAAIANFNFLDDGCPQSQFNFLSESIFAESVTWLFGDGDEGEGESTSHVYQSEGIYDVTLLAHGFDGITDTFTIANAVTIHPEPVAAFTIDEDYVFAEVDSAVFFNQSTGGTQYFWNFGNGNTSSAFEPTPYYALVGTYDISLTVTNNFGCQDQYIVPDGVTVVSDGFINFPSAFTPLSNGPTDGIYDRLAFDNNIFHPHSRSIKFYELEIFNKWGEMIFQTDDIKQGWDGYYQGQMVNEDIYVYKSKGQLFGGVPFEKSGTITLLLK